MADQVPIIGVDLGKGGGSKAEFLPCAPSSMLLIPAKPTYDVAESSSYVVVDVWGFDPKLTVALGFWRVPNANASPSDALPSSNIHVMIKTRTLARSPAGDAVASDYIDPAKLFSSAGAFSAAHIDDRGDGDGCEIKSAVQGLRFEVTGQRTGPTTVDVVLQAQARTNEPMGCRAMAIALLQGVTVEKNVVWGF